MHTIRRTEWRASICVNMFSSAFSLFRCFESIFSSLSLSLCRPPSLPVYLCHLTAIDSFLLPTAQRYMGGLPNGSDGMPWLHNDLPDVDDQLCSRRVHHDRRRDLYDLCSCRRRRIVHAEGPQVRHCWHMKTVEIIPITINNCIE